MAVLDAALERGRPQASLRRAWMAGLVAAALGAAVWTVVWVLAVDRYVWLAIGVGALVGFAVRRLGAGRSAGYGLVAGACAVLALAVGNVLALAGLVADYQDGSMLDVLGRWGVDGALNALAADFDATDAASYVLAAVVGFLVGRAPAEHAGLAARRVTLAPGGRSIDGPAVQYPILLTFKLWSLGQHVRVTDGSGALVLYVKQKAFRLKQDIEIFRDEAKTELAYRVHGDRAFGSVRYVVHDAAGRVLGAVQRQMLRSFWSASYRLLDANEAEFGRIREENPWIKVLDGLIGEIPIVGWVLQVLINPAYLVEVPEGEAVLYLRKRRSLLERRFEIERLGSLPAEREAVVLPSVVTFALMERHRG